MDSSLKEFEQHLEKMKFEEALRELETIVRQLEGGTLPLEEMVLAHSKGLLLQTFCQRKLEEARLRVSKISETEGSFKTTPIVMNGTEPVL